MLIQCHGLFIRGSPNIEMDEETFLVNRERAVDYLNSLEKVSLSSTILYVVCVLHFSKTVFVVNWNYPFFAFEELFLKLKRLRCSVLSHTQVSC